jgi:DNA-binding response OmpR family regulator
MPLPHLLVIDDDPQIRRVLERALSRHFVVACVASAETALALSETAVLFDVFLCDLNLPRMSGQEFHDALKGRSLDLASRVVIMTGADREAGGAFATMMGGRYLLKPCSITELIATLRKAADPRVSAPPCAPVAAA